MLDGCSVSAFSLAVNGVRQVRSRGRYQLFWVERGGCAVAWEGRRWECGAADLILMQPGQAAVLAPGRRRHAARVIRLELEEELLVRLSGGDTDLLKSFSFVPFGCAVVTAGSSTALLAKNLANRIYKASVEPQFGNEVFMRGLLSALLVLVLRQCIATDFRRPVERRPVFWVDGLFVFIREHLGEELTLARLEKEFFVSHEHIAREFKKQTGQTVHQYILKQRLEESCRLLKTGMAVVDIWRRCGFNSYSYFFQAFKRRYGVTPSAFARETV